MSYTVAVAEGQARVAEDDDVDDDVDDDADDDGLDEMLIEELELLELVVIDVVLEEEPVNDDVDWAD